MNDNIIGSSLSILPHPTYIKLAWYTRLITVIGLCCYYAEKFGLKIPGKVCNYMYKNPIQFMWHSDV